MTVQKYIKKILLIGLVVLSAGGILLHSRIHPVTANNSNFVPLISCILSILVVPTLFCFRKTISYGYVLNGFLVITGTITMSHYSIAHWPSPATFHTVLFNTLIADILILWGKFFIGKAIFDLETFGYEPVPRSFDLNTIRYPNLGWWIVHLAAVSIVYAIGFVFWR